MTHMRAKHRNAALIAMAALFAGACGGGGDGPVTPPTPTTGTLTITIETVGNLPDPNGYQVTRTGAAPIDVPVSGSVRLDSVAPGTYSFTIGKASLYCAPENGGTREAQVVAGQNAQVTFRVRCEANGLAYATVKNAIGSLHIVFPGRDSITLATGTSLSRMQFSPDRRRIAYTGYPDGGRAAIFAIDLDSLRVTQLTPSDGRSRVYPAWSPDGTRIAFADDAELRVIRVGETAESTLWRARVPSETWVSVPTWSPDGSRIAFVLAGELQYQEQHPPRIMIINADGTGERELITLTTPPYVQIDWSPDGRSIVYTDRVPRQPSIVYAVDVASGARRVVLSATDRNYLHASYLRDGRIGLYAQTFPALSPAGNWIVNADGTGLTRVQMPGLGAVAPITAWQ